MIRTGCTTARADRPDLGSVDTELTDRDSDARSSAARTGSSQLLGCAWTCGRLGAPSCPVAGPDTAVRRACVTLGPWPFDRSPLHSPCTASDQALGEPDATVPRHASVTSLVPARSSGRLRRPCNDVRVRASELATSIRPAAGGRARSRDLAAAVAIAAAPRASTEGAGRSCPPLTRDQAGSAARVRPMRSACSVAPPCRNSKRLAAVK